MFWFQWNRYLVLFGFVIGAAQAGSAFGAWSTCPSVFAYLDCDDPGWDICVWSGANNRIECTGFSTNDEIVVVEEGGKPWAYGTVDNTDFCCDSSDMLYTGVEVYVDAGAGNDIVCLHDEDSTSDGCDGYDANFQTWDGPGYIEGGIGIDHLDTAWSGSYDDTVDGGPGADKIFTYDGDDTVYGQAGADTVYAGDGDDYVSGGGDDDTIYGGDGVDTLAGDDGDDYLYGNEDDDILNGGNQEDHVYGGPGADDVCGDGSRDHVYGDQDAYDCVCGGNSTTPNDGSQDYLYGGAAGYDECHGDGYDVYDTTTCETYGAGNCTCGC